MLSIFESAALTGRFCSVEFAYFSVLGERVASAAIPRVAVLLAAASRAHGYRAELFRDLLPVSSGLPSGESLTVTPGENFDAMLSLLGACADEAICDVLGRGIYPAMARAYDERAARCSPIADGPLIGVLHRVRSDLVRVTRDMLFAERERSEETDHFVGRVVAMGGPFGTGY